MKKFFKKIKYRLIYTPIKKSLISFFILLFLIPVCIISLMYFIVLKNALQQWEINHIKESLVQTEQVFNKSLAEIREFADRVYVNKQLQHILITDYSDIQTLYSDYSSIAFIEDYLQVSDEIENFRIYASNQTLLDNYFIHKLNSEIVSQEWYKNAVRLNGQPFWIYKYDSLSKSTNLCLIRSMKNSDGQTTGVFEISLKPETIEKYLSSQIFDTAIAFNNKIIYSSSNLRNGIYIYILDNALLNNQLQSERFTNISFPEETKGVIVETFTPHNAVSLTFKVMYVIPMEYIIKSTHKILFFSVLVIVMMIFLFLVFIIFFSNHIDERVGKVRKGISQIIDNQFEIPASIGGKDEFEQIYNSLYLMSGKLKNLIDENYKQKLEKEQLTSMQNEISFKMLSTQINPHFLFNTLETIRMKSLAGGDREVATMLKLLASLLRYNLSVKGTPVPLIKELDSVQNYLNIQHSRFGDRISYDIVTMCDIQNVSILPLLIQPLVENSFSHGLEDKVSGGFIYILISSDVEDNQKQLIITVKDNGCGIDEKKLKELNDSLNSDKVLEKDEKTSIGLKNIQQRIRLFYGPEYGVSVFSEFGEGTTVTIRIKG